MEAFSKRQWQKHFKKGSKSSRKCNSCINVFLSKSGSKGNILVRDHALSNGLVDGSLHHVPGKIIKDRAMRCNVVDREVANKLYHDFLSRFQVFSMTIEDILVFGHDIESYQRFLSMTSVPPDDPISSHCIYDFLTTIRTPTVLHQQFSYCPNTLQSHYWPIGTFLDSPSMTKGSQLKFCCPANENQFVTSFKHHKILRHSTGTVLQDSNGTLLGARCSASMSKDISLELLLIYNQMELHRCFLMRGKDVANVCSNFVVTGLKQDLNTKLKMAHSPKNHNSALLEMEMRSKLRGIFRNHVYPIVCNEFRWLFHPINSWLVMNKVVLHSYFVSGVTAGKLFWPRSHIDHDVWFTVLVCLDYGRGVNGGGDFGFGSVGHVLQCKHGDVFVYNPTHPHGTTEFDLHPNEPESGRIFFAFFMKKNVLHADLLSQAMVNRVGVQNIKLP